MILDVANCECDIYAGDKVDIVTYMRYLGHSITTNNINDSLVKSLINDINVIVNTF